MTNMNINHVNAIYKAIEANDRCLNADIAQKTGIANSTSSKYLSTLTQLGVIYAEPRRNGKGKLYSLKEGGKIYEATCHKCKEIKPIEKISFSCTCFACNRSRDGEPAPSPKHSGHVVTTDLSIPFNGQQPDMASVWMIAANRKINRLQMSM